MVETAKGDFYVLNLPKKAPFNIGFLFLKEYDKITQVT